MAVPCYSCSISITSFSLSGDGDNAAFSTSLSLSPFLPVRGLFPEREKDAAAVSIFRGPRGELSTPRAVVSMPGPLWKRGREGGGGGKKRKVTQIQNARLALISS